MSEEINHERRRLLGSAVLTIAAAELGRETLDKHGGCNQVTKNLRMASASRRRACSWQVNPADPHDARPIRSSRLRRLGSPT
jgi:hypothetical protein